MSKKRTISRRSLLRDSAAAAAGGAALLAQVDTAFGQAPAVVTQRRFKAWISRGNGPGRTTLHDATLRPISGRQVVVRTEATNLCYTLVPAVLGLAPPPLPTRSRRQCRAGSRRRRAAAHQRHGRHPGSRRRRHRRSRRPRGAARASRRPRLRVGHAALRRVLSLPARPVGHVPVLERDRCRRSRRDRAISPTARPSIRTRTSAASPRSWCRSRSGSCRSSRPSRPPRSAWSAAARAWPGLARRPARVDGDRARLERCRRRLRADRALRRAGCAHRRRVDDHRDRSDSRAARGRAESRRDARARSERRRGRPHRQGALADDLADRPALGRRTQPRRPPPRRGRRPRRRSRGVGRR